MSYNTKAISVPANAPFSYFWMREFFFGLSFHLLQTSRIQWTSCAFNQLDSSHNAKEFDLCLRPAHSVREFDQIRLKPDFSPLTPRLVPRVRPPMPQSWRTWSTPTNESIAVSSFVHLQAHKLERQNRTFPASPGFDEQALKRKPSSEFERKRKNAECGLIGQATHPQILKSLEVQSSLQQSDGSGSPNTHTHTKNYAAFTIFSSLNPSFSPAPP